MAKECYRKSTEVESKSEKMIKISKNDLCWQISLGAIDKGFPHRLGGGDSIKTDIYRQGRTGFNQMGMSTFRY